MELRKETKDDWWEVEALFDLCFAPGREALSSYRLRDDLAPISSLCLVARDTLGILGGAVRYWEVSVADHPVLLLGPVAVHPTRQGEGLGGLLMNESLAQAKADDWERGDAGWGLRLLSAVWVFKTGACHHATTDQSGPRFGTCSCRRGLGWDIGHRSEKIPFLRGAISYAVQRYFISGRLSSLRVPSVRKTSLNPSRK